MHNNMCDSAQRLRASNAQLERLKQAADQWQAQQLIRQQERRRARQERERREREQQREQEAQREQEIYAEVLAT
ncbi:hypothetical protein AGMMS50233_00820 [Endomicrobiia bacterium]|nr:hypothetical protein AGMMS50233_00820 [Endomicrobiia bacterium]